MKSQCGAALFGFLISVNAFAGTIPNLKWEPRSDWVNVKTDLTPKAIGDGIADDTAALQEALNHVKAGSTVYLPPGTYRITKTLDFNQPRPTGVLLIGHGSATIIQWDGPGGGHMLWQHGGAPDSRYVGLTWNGGGKAAIGIDHASKTFETEVTHQHEAFLNFTDCGIRIGSREAPPGERRQESAEIVYDNCLFENCGRGVAFILFNDYDNTFDGCEFRHCGIGIQDIHGNFYARNCHFVESSIVDFSVQSEHGSSIRRCTSVGSKCFVDDHASVAPLTIQDCHVARWTGPDGAIILGAAPVIMFDCTFTQPPSDRYPVKIRKAAQRLILSQNTAAGKPSVVDPAGPGKVYEIPAGAVRGSLKSAEQSFLTSEMAVPGRIFDAKRDFGAKGDGSADDTAAIQKAVDAAKADGNDAIAYIPTGLYLIKQTIHITGSDYVVGGTGFNTRILWRGDEHGTMFLVHDPDRITLEHLNIGSHDVGAMKNDADILQTSSGKPSSVCYDDVHVFGKYDKQPDRKGLRFADLSETCVVHIRQIEGNIRFTDSAQAAVLADTSYEGSITVEGKDKRRGGFLGFQTRLCTSTPHALYVRDNHSFIASDFYVEQAEDGLSIQGADGDPPGRVVLQGAKVHTKKGPITIDNYAGQIFLGHDQYYGEPNPAVVSIQGTRPLDFCMLGNSFYNTKLELKRNDATKVILIGNVTIGASLESDPVADTVTPETAGKVAGAFDELRKLGALDLKLNHPNAAK